MHPERLKLALAFAAVYLVWGSTYLAIRVGVENLPPALFAGARWLAGGALLSLYAHTSGQTLPRSSRELKIIAVMGMLFVVGGNGLVVWAEQWMASNLTALIVASTALWIAAFGTLGRQGENLALSAKLGLGLGFIGVTALLLPSATDVSPDHAWAQLAVLTASLLWASGTIYGRRQPSRTPPLMNASLQMLIGGLFLTLLGVSRGEIASWTWDFQAALSLAYLAVFGSVAFAAYLWLLHQVTPAKLGTYAYINPLVAVLLGWWLLGERLAPQQLMGTVVILAGVALVTRAPGGRAPKA